MISPCVRSLRGGGDGGGAAGALLLRGLDVLLEAGAVVIARGGGGASLEATLQATQHTATRAGFGCLGLLEEWGAGGRSARGEVLRRGMAAGVMRAGLMYRAGRLREALGVVESVREARGDGAGVPPQGLYLEGCIALLLATAETGQKDPGVGKG
ncbi:hypothetical protein T484DRAFT_1912464, partial [Baffinella frigidus]